MSKKGESFFWTSYSDLMTSLFFIMLVLFVLVIALLHSRMVDIEAEKRATEEELNRITAITQSIQKIDTTFFQYDPEYNRFSLKGMHVEFQTGYADINYYKISEACRDSLYRVGLKMKEFMENAHTENPEAEYLVIIEGQASKEPEGSTFSEYKNQMLSYERSLSLFNFWISRGVKFDKMPWVEVILSGSGTLSRFRVEPEWHDEAHRDPNTANQRFVIHIVPKPGNMKSAIEQK